LLCLVYLRSPENALQITLWGDFASNPGDMLESAASQGVHPVLAVKNGRVGDFNGKNLSTLATSDVSEM
jgi:replication factor A1